MNFYKLTIDIFQEEYHVADLRKELSLVKKLLMGETARSGMESQKLDDAQSLFAKAFKDYSMALETLKQVHQRKVGNQLYISQCKVILILKPFPKMQELQDAKHSGQASSAAEVDALTAKLVQAEDQIRDERVKAQVLHDKVRQMELDIEAIPILKAQVEVYQSDFNAERAAREKIAGEKADLQEEIRKIQQRQNQLTNDLGALPVIKL